MTPLDREIPRLIATALRPCNGLFQEQVAFETPEGSITVQTTRQWTLPADGKTLKIELNVQDPNGTHQSKRTFNRK